VPVAISPEELSQELARIDDPAASAVAEWQVRVDNDWSGDPAIHVVIVLRDERVRDVWPGRESLRTKARDLLRQLAPERWPFIAFSAQSDSLDPEMP
jgi:hypothetical protein